MLLTYLLNEQDRRGRDPILRELDDKKSEATRKALARFHANIGTTVKLTNTEHQAFMQRYVLSGEMDKPDPENPEVIIKVDPTRFESQKYRVVDAELRDDLNPHQGMTFWCEPV